MLEEVVDSLLFHQPGYKVVVCFTVLDTVLARCEVRIQSELEIAKPEIVENLGNDLRRRLVLKDPAIGRSGQEPKPWRHFRAIHRQPPILRSLRKPCDVAAPVTLTAMGIE